MAKDYCRYLLQSMMTISTCVPIPDSWFASNTIILNIQKKKKRNDLAKIKFFEDTFRKGGNMFGSYQAPRCKHLNDTDPFKGRIKILNGQNYNVWREGWA